MDKDDVTAVVCAYTERRWDDICAAVQSLRDQNLRPAAIMVVIDHNSVLLEMAERAFVDATVIANRHERGLSGGRNTALEAARTPLVAFLDDDAIADRDWLAHMAPLCRDPETMGVMSRVEPIWMGARPRWFPEEFFWAIGCSYLGQPTTTREVRNLMGGAMVVKRALYERSGPFNGLIGRKGAFPISCEETEWCIRARAAAPQIKFYMEPKAVIRHKATADRLTWKYFVTRCFAEGLSKAYMTSLLANNAPLRTEGRYVLETLSFGILKGLGDAVRLDAAGLARAAAIVVGLSSTTAGFLLGKAQTFAGFVDLQGRERHA
ncbi:MAG: glycosyltransferase family 2 protein [Rhodoblastus sp.]